MKRGLWGGGLALVLLLPSAIANAALIWDATPSDPPAAANDGGGTWQDGGTANWVDTAPDPDVNVAWSNASPNVAQFGLTRDTKTKYPITIIGTVKTTGITSYRQYQLGYDGTVAGGTIELAGPTPTISLFYNTYLYAGLTTADDVTQVKLIAGGKIGTIDYSGYAYLSGANDFDAPLVIGCDPSVVAVGMLALQNHDNALGGDSTAGITVVNGSTLSFRSANLVTAKPITIAGTGYGDRGALSFYTAGTGVVCTRDLQGPLTLVGDALINTREYTGLAHDNTISGVVSGDYVLSVAGDASNAPGRVRFANAANQTKGLNISSVNGDDAWILVTLSADYIATQSATIGLDSILEIEDDATLTTPLVSLAANRAVLKGGGRVVGDVTTVAGSSIKPGSSIGSLTIDGDLMVGGTLDIEYDGDHDTIDLLAVSNELDLTGATLSFSNLGTGMLGPGPHVFATYGTLTGSPAGEVGVPNGWQVVYGYNGNSIALVPEPAAIALLLGLAVALAGSRRRPNA